MGLGTIKEKEELRDGIASQNIFESVSTAWKKFQEQKAASVELEKTEEKNRKGKSDDVEGMRKKERQRNRVERRGMSI